MESLVNTPDTFESWEAAEKWLQDSLSLLGWRTPKNIDGLQIKIRIYMLCETLRTPSEPIFDAIRRGE